MILSEEDRTRISGFWSPDVRWRDPGTELTRQQLTLRRKLYKVILKDPEHFQMGNWETPGDITGSCGTSRCVAGWAVFLDGVTQADVALSEVVPFGWSSRQWEAMAVSILGLTEDEYFNGASAWSMDQGLFFLTERAALRRMEELCYF